MNVLLSLTVACALFLCNHSIRPKKGEKLRLYNASQTLFPYKLSSPDKKRVLPEILNEVSGLTDIDTAHIACVQDEIGTIFIYNFKTDSIVYKHSFEALGDFEGLTFTSKSLFILRSDGRLTEWKKFNPSKGGKKITHTILPLLTSNNEGLCYDADQNRLLIAAKSKPILTGHKSDRYIYEYNLAKNKFNPNPVYTLNTESLEIAAKKCNIVKQDTTVRGKQKPFNFRPASLAVHPITSEIYIISAADRLLVVMNKKGEIKHVEELQQELFAKAEGITFLNDGTLIITNEASGNVPTLLLYKYQSAKQ